MLNASESSKSLSMAWLEGLVYVLALALVVAIGALNLPFPFVSDQIMSLVGAQTLAAGGTLYVDFWDNKLPGLIWFHQLAGAWFGFTEIGLHTLDLIWMSCFALLLALLLRGYYQYRWLSAVAALAAVGTYYASAETFHLTQLEILVALPVFLSLWCASRWPQRELALARNFFLSGVCAGVTVTFKIVFAPLFPALWLVASVYLLRQRGWQSLLLALWLPAVMGTALVLAAVGLRFWLDGALDELIYTTFIYPPLALASSPPAPWYRLLDSVVYFGAYFADWGIFAGIGAWYWWRRERDPVTAMVLVWLILGFGLIIIQRFSWWSYHFLFLYAPAAILGVRGVDVATRLFFPVEKVGTRRANGFTALLACAVAASLAVPVGQKANVYVEVVLRKHGGVAELQEGLSPDYPPITRSVRFLNDAGARPGPIYVFGDPLYYYLSGRRPALPRIGWAWEFYPQSDWLELPEQLREARPAYIYIDQANAKRMALRGGGVDTFITRYYVELFRDHKGTWYGARADSAIRPRAGEAR